MIPKIKTLAEYQQLASRTCPDLGKVENDLHMWAGIQTEMGEMLDPFKKKLAYNKPLDLVNVGEELADAVWYEVNDLRMKNIPINDLYFAEDLDLYIRLYNEDVTDRNNEKINLIYTLEIARVFVSEYDESAAEKNLAFYAFICHIWKLDFFQILTNNITKLMVRYPQKFTEDAALNRNLDAEREQLEKTEE